MNYAQIKDMDIVNGRGIAVSLFVSGCPHHCKGCFNQETWSYGYGKLWTKEIEDKFIELCKRQYIDCVSILGGEPLAQDINMLLLLTRIKKEVNKPIYVWTGYTLEYLKQEKKKTYDVLNWCGIYLIDGRFEEDKYDPTLILRGSSNQRIWKLEDEPKDITEEIDKENINES